MKRELILLNVMGVDRTGVTASMTEILGHYGATMLDIGQANLYHQLSIGLLVRLDNVEHSGDMLKEILFRCAELDMQVRFQSISEEQYSQWVNQQGKSRYVVNILGHEIKASQVCRVTRALALRNLNIDSIKRLTGRPPLDDEPSTSVQQCIEFSVRGAWDDKEEMSREFLDIAFEEGVDISFQKDDIYRRSRRLICLDMDSTLTKSECIDELAERAGVGEQVKAITASAMRGEIDFKESFTRRVALLKGLPIEVLDDV